MSHAEPIAPLYDHERDDALDGRRRGAAHDWGADDLFDGTRQARRGHRFARAEGRFDRGVTHEDDHASRGTGASRRASAPWSDLSTAPADRDAQAAPRRRAVADDLDAPATPHRRVVADAFDAPAAPRRRAPADDFDAPAAPHRRAVADDLDAPSGRDRDRADDGGEELGGPRWPADESGAPRERAVADWFADDERKRVDDWLAAGRDTTVVDDDHAVQPASSTAPTLELDLPLGETRPARRTVTVTGHPDAVRRAERAGEIARRRPAPSLDARIAHRPDRVAMYACALGLLLVLVAIATANT